MKLVVRTGSYLADLDDIERFIAHNSPQVAASLCSHIDDQVEQLADPHFPRRSGRVRGTFELVAHKNYVVIFWESANEVTAVNIIHTRKRYP